MKWLITGGCGFLGIRLINKLISHKNNKIRVLDNLSVGNKKDLSSVAQFIETKPEDLNSNSKPDSLNIELVIGDILDEKLALEASKGMDAIVHLAANTGVAPSVDNPRMDCETNIFGTLNYLEAARFNNVSRFVFASSGAPIGECEPPIHEEMPPHPVSPYGASKLAGEGYCSAYNRSFGVETVALRFGNVYGPGSSHKSSVVAKFIKNALAGLDVEIYGDGNQTRDFIYVSDLIDAIMNAATVPNIGGEVFQIATYKESTVNEITEIISRQLYELGGIKMKVKHSSPRLGDVKRNFSNIEKARTKLNWQPETGLETGIEKTIKWFQEYSQGSG